MISVPGCAALNSRLICSTIAPQVLLRSGRLSPILSVTLVASARTAGTPETRPSPSTTPSTSPSTVVGTMGPTSVDFMTASRDAGAPEYAVLPGPGHDGV